MEQRSFPSIYILTKGGEDFPSTRFRVHQYAPFFREEGVTIAIQKPSRGAGRVLQWYRHRRHDLLLVQKRFFNPLERWLLRRLFRVVVYDFDDAMGVPSSHKRENPRRLRRRKRQLRAMCRWADVVVCCNEELRALSGRPDARLLPTPYRREPEAPVADTPETDPLRLLWIGMDLTKLRPWEEELAAIAGGDPGVRIVLSSHKQKPPPFAFPFHYERWSREKERELLAGGGLGIMPLEDDANSRGKCALKLIQYMAHGLVPVASDVGFNREVVRDGVDGFLCPTPRRLRDVVRAARAGELDLAGLRRAALERAEQFSARALYPRLKEILWTAWESRR